MADVERVAREIHILKLIRHPNIIQLYEIIETERQLYLIMEYASGGELFDYIVTKGRLKEPEACRYFQQIVDGVEYLHSLNIVHRDLKPENLLLDSNKNIKIVDFGLSNTFNKGETLITACGSPCYAAPEMIAGLPYLGARVDTWSCGIIMFALICGYLPFEDPVTTNLYQKILKGEFQIPRFVSKEASELIKFILCTDPQKRYTLPQVRKHSWFNQIPHTPKRGVDLEHNPIIISPELLSLLETKYQFKKEIIENSVLKNKHNHVTTTYYLLQQKFERDINYQSQSSQLQPQVIPHVQTTIQAENQIPQKAQSEEEDTYEYKDQPLSSMDEERSLNNNQTANVYSPRERNPPGASTKNQAARKTLQLVINEGKNVNKLEPSAQQKEIEQVVNSARTDKHHKKSVSSQSEISNIKSGSQQKKPPIESISPGPNASKDQEDGKSRHPNQVFLDNSRSEQQAGFNVSYENSLSVIRRDIKRETLDKKVSVHLQNATQKPPKLAISIQFDPIEEKPSNQSTNRSAHQVSKKNTTSIKNGNKVMNEYLSKPSPKNVIGQQHQMKIGDKNSNTLNLLRPKTQQNKNQGSASATSKHNQSYNSNDSQKNAQSPAQNYNSLKQQSVDVQEAVSNKIIKPNTNSVIQHIKGKVSNLSAQIINQALFNNSGQQTPKTNQSHFESTSGALKIASQSYQTAPAANIKSFTSSSAQPSNAKASLKPQTNKTSLSINSGKRDITNVTYKNVKTTQVTINSSSQAQQIPKPPPNHVNILMAKNYLSSTPKSKANQLFLMNSLSLTSKAIYQQQLSKSPVRGGNAESARLKVIEKPQPSVQSQLQKLIINGLYSPVGGSSNTKMFESQSQRGKVSTASGANASRISSGKVLGPKLLNSQQLDQHTTTNSTKDVYNRQPNQQQGGMRISRGAFNLSCSTMRKPEELITAMQDLLPTLGINYRLIPSSYVLVCTKNTVCFEMEITQYEYTDFLYVVKFKKIQNVPLNSSRQSQNNGTMSENDEEFRKISESIIKELKL